MYPFVYLNVASPFHRTLSQAYLSKRAKRRIGLSATPVVNRPLDLAGICTALAAPDYLQSAVADLNHPIGMCSHNGRVAGKSYWCTDSHHRNLDPRALVAFRK
jgi:hypothetical protein